MTRKLPERQIPQPTEAVIAWLLDSDPSIRWQVLRDLTGAPAGVGQPSRWNTLRALRVLDWYDR